MNKILSKKSNQYQNQNWNEAPNLKLEDQEIHLNQEIDKILKKFFIQFSNTMNNHFQKDDLIIFYNNINHLTISYNTFKHSIFKKYAIAYYNKKTNEIKVDKTYLSTAIFHELLHMSSCIYKDGISYSGFYQLSDDYTLDLGLGINEGYTELLNRRYFHYDEQFKSGYQLEIKIVEKLEEVIGKNKMEKLYLSANLPGLIAELKQYSKEEEIIEFISNIDFITKHLDDLFGKIMLPKVLNNINQFLIKIYSEKLVIHHQEYSNEQIITEIYHYVSSLDSIQIIGETNYKTLLSEKDILKCIETTIGKNLILKKSNK